MVEDLLHYFGSAERTGVPRHRVARGGARLLRGVDIKETTIARCEDAVVGLTEQRRFSDIIRRMRRCPQPVIALVHGPACGGGFSIALAAMCASPARAPDERRVHRIGFSGSDMGSSYFCRGWSACPLPPSCF